MNQVNDLAERERRDHVLETLHSEKGFLAVYLASRNLRFSFFNQGLACATSIIFGISAIDTDLDQAKQGISELCALAFTASVGILGFLIAGLSFFATSSDPKLLQRMAELDDEETGISHLKHDFFLFMRVFAEFLVMAGVGLAGILFFGGSFSLFEDFAAAINLEFPNSGKAVQYGTNMFSAIFLGAFVFCLLELKSFIFNVYSIVMTTVQWGLMQHYETLGDPTKKNVESPDDTPT